MTGPPGTPPAVLPRLLAPLLAANQPLAAHMNLSAAVCTGMTGEQAADGEYRYALARDWTPAGCEPRLLVAVCLNPSTATAAAPDVTTTKLVGYARRAGYTGLILGNLAALRATSPQRLVMAENPHGPWNEAMLAALMTSGLPVLAAWGNNAARPRLLPGARRLAAVMHTLAVETWCLGVTVTGQPRHPARLLTETPLTRWAPASLLRSTRVSP